MLNQKPTGGWIQHNWKQMYKQLAYVAAAMGYTFVMTAIIAKAFDLVPFLRLRADETSETIGMDDAEVCCSISRLHLGQGPLSVTSRFVKKKKKRKKLINRISSCSLYFPARRVCTGLCRAPTSLRCVECTRQLSRRP